jgi:hypothetical protein
MRQLAGRHAIALLLFLAPASVRSQDADPAAEKKKLAELQRERFVFDQNAVRAIQALAKTLQSDPVAWMDLRPTAESPEATEAAPILQPALLQIFLREGVLLFPFEEGHKLGLEYKEGKLPKGSLLSGADYDYLNAQGAKNLILPLLAGKGPNFTVTFDVVQLATRQKVATSALPVVTKKFTLKELCEIDVVPARNVKVLTFAAAHLGKQVDRGECWDLAANPVRGNGGKVEGYVFGKEVKWEDARPGDVITFGTSGETGGHVVVLYKWTKDRAAATILHQNVNNVRRVMLGSLGQVESNKAGQKLAIWRP